MSPQHTPDPDVLIGILEAACASLQARADLGRRIVAELKMRSGDVKQRGVSQDELRADPVAKCALRWLGAI